MRDVHEIVDFGTAADDRIIDAAAIDCRVGTDLYVVADDATPNVRDFPVRPFAKHVAETVAADPRSRMHKDAVTERSSTIDGDRGPETRAAS